MEKIAEKKKTLESISCSIQVKRNEEFDSLEFPVSKLVLAEYDIRENRDTDKLAINLKRDGQLQPITVSINDGIFTVVNGRTRFLAIQKIRETENLFSRVKIEAYSDLTELEQNYLNAQINVSQNPLTPNEKVNFVKKYKNELDPIALGAALGIDKAMLVNYIEVAEYTKKVLEAFSPQNEGHGRSSVKVEELGKISKAYKSENGGKAPSVETMVEIGKKLDSSKMTRDVKRKFVPRAVKKVATLMKNKIIAEKYTDTEIVNIAMKEAKMNGGNGGSGDDLPKNSSGKYKFIDKLLTNQYEFAVILFSEGLKRKTEDGMIDSETKRIVDSVDEIIIVGNEIEKLVEVEAYAIEKGKKIIFHNKDVIEACALLESDDRKGFVYVNGASLFAQRPQFMNYLKKKFVNSTISMIILDLIFGQSKIDKSKRTKECLTVYGGAESFDEVLAEYKNQVKFLKLRKFADTPQQKYIAYV